VYLIDLGMQHGHGGLARLKLNVLESHQDNLWTARLLRLTMCADLALGLEHAVTRNLKDNG
jgi:hypothetical protein